MNTYKIWLHIEEIDEHGYPEDDEPTLPTPYGEFDTLDAAQEAVDLVMSGHDYRPRPSAPDKSETKHTQGPWKAKKLGDMGFRISHKHQDGIDHYLCHGYDEKNAELIAAAPSLLNMLQRMLDETSGGGRPCLCTLEHARNALAQAKGNQP